MTCGVFERPDSREWSGGNLIFKFNIEGTPDHDVALASLLAAVPTVQDGLTREPYPTVEPAWASDSLGNGLWIGTVRYLRHDANELPALTIGQRRVRWSTKGGTQHIVHSLQTQSVYCDPSVGGVAPIFGPVGSPGGGGIAYNGQDFEGVDIVVPTFNFTVEKVYNPSSMPSDGTFFATTGCINDASWTVTDSLTDRSITLNASECLMLGAEQQDPRTDGGIVIRMEFSALPTKTGLNVGRMTGISKNGWDYLWVLYRASDDAGAKTMVKKPWAVYVEQVYPTASFSALAV